MESRMAAGLGMSDEIMLPFALLACCLHGDDERTAETRVTGISAEGFKIRTSEKIDALVGNLSEIELLFWKADYSERDGKYERVLLRTYSIYELTHDEFSFVYKVDLPENAEYIRKVNRLLKQYYDYIMLKTEDDDGTLAKECAGYPSELDDIVTCDFSSQKKAWFAKAREDAYRNGHGKSCGKASFLQESIKSGKLELAIELDNPILWKKFAETDRNYLFVWYKENFGLNAKWLCDASLDRIYIGNQFCHNLFPDKMLLEKMLEKAKAEKLAVTISTTYMREELAEETEQKMRGIYHWCSKNQYGVEIVVNDWGMFDIIKDMDDYITPVLGTLLNKVRKDPRSRYFMKGMTEGNALNSEFYRDFLKKEYNVERYEFESIGFVRDIPQGKHSLHMPYYQTNTSQYCPLYAEYKSGGRGKQHLIKECEKYCLKYVLSYPDHLRMAGRYNSLFGCSPEVLYDEEVLAECMRRGINRFVFNMM